MARSAYASTLDPLPIDELVYLPVKSPATRVAALLSGEVDFVQDLPIQDIARLRADCRWPSACRWA